MREKLKKARQESGMTQQEIANNIQNKKRRIKVIGIVQLIAIVLAVSKILVSLR